MNKIDQAALKNGALIAAIAVYVFEGLTILVQLVDPQGGLLRVKFRNPLQHLIIIAAALALGTAAYFRAWKKNRNKN